MFKVIVNDGNQELPDDDIYYVIAKEGVFLKKKMGIMESIAPVKGISILQSINAMAKMHINPLPATMGAKILEFFKEVYRQYHGEAIVILFYNEKTGKYKLIAPEQKVTAASLDYKRDIQIDDFSMIGTIHSHGAMSAFHSGTDTDDEKAFDGLHITYGQVTQDEFSLSASIVANGHRFMIMPEDYMLGLTKTKDIDETVMNYTAKVYKWVEGKMVLDEKASSKTGYKTRRFDKRYVFNVSPSKRKFPPSWMDNVSQGTYTYAGYGYYGWGGYGWADGANDWRNGSQYGRRWGKHYDASAWGQRRLPPGQKPSSPLNVGPSATIKPLEFPKHDIVKYDVQNPCMSCIHRDKKILDEMNDINYDDETFYCEKCQRIIISDDVDVKCPICKTDEHLSTLDQTQLRHNHQIGTPKSIAEGRAPLAGDYIQQPNQYGMVTCNSCKSSFLRLEGDEFCPFCDKPLDAVPVEIEQEWECPYCEGVFGESEILHPNHCPHCDGLIELTSEDVTTDQEILICPKCQAENKLESLETLGQCSSCGCPSVGMREAITALEEQTRKDSGAYLDQTEEEHSAILKEAAEADKRLQRIPDPEKPTTPLTASERIKNAMGRMFGGKDHDTIH